MNRRHFLKSSAISCSVLQQPFSMQNASASLVDNCYKNTSAASYISAAKSSAGLFSLQHFDSQGQVLQSFDLPKRGHSFAMNDQGYLLSISRRPGEYFLVIDPSLPNSESRLVKAPSNRRYYGHAAFNTTGNLAYLTENNLDSSQGVIGIYDVKKQFKRIGEFPSYGIGPHAICFDKQRECLVIANGGVKTHPSSGRKKMNISTMQSNLAFINPVDGSLIDIEVLDEECRFNSIRHLDIDANSNVFISLQNQKINSQQTLLAIYRHNDKSLLPCRIPSEFEPNLKRYLGDISLDHSENFFTTTSPKGNLVLLYHADGRFIAAHEIKDVCGVSQTNQANEFIVTTGNGEIYSLHISGNKHASVTINRIASFYGKLGWDNHLLLI